MTLPDVDLPKLAGAAGSAIGLIISTAVLLSWLTARYAAADGQYRSLTAELRGYRDQTRRRELLREQIAQYRRRLLLLNRASGLRCGVMGLAIATILAAAVSLVAPGDPALGAAGAAALFLALAADAVAVGYMFVENLVDRHAILAEAGDIDEVNG